MKNSQRILDSIGKLSDDMIESAVNYENPENKRKKINTTSARPMKKLAVSVIAAVLCIALAVTCFANADLIKSLFQREQELVDPYAIKVDNSVTVGDITLTIDKIACGDEYYVYYTIKNNNGIFDKGLTFDRIAIKEGVGYFTNRDTVGIIDGPEERGSDPNSSIAIAGYGLENPSDTISAMFRTDLNSGMYTLAFENVTSYDGSVKYADEITFEAELPQRSGKPGEKGSISREFRDLVGTFNLEGKEMALESIKFTPYGVTVYIREYGTDTINYFGHDFYYSAFIEGFSIDTSKEQLDYMMKDCLKEKQYYDTGLNKITTEYGYVEGYPETATIKIPIKDEDDYWGSMRRFEDSQDIHSHKEELDKLAYTVYAKLADGCTAEVITRTQNAYVASQKFDDGTIDCHIKSLVELKFSTPVYEEEILEIYLLRESDGSRVTIYQKPE